MIDTSSLYVNSIVWGVMLIAFFLMILTDKIKFKNK